MPNWVSNNVRIRGNKKLIKEFVDSIITNKQVDFDKIVPIDKSKYRTNVLASTEKLDHIPRNYKTKETVKAALDRLCSESHIELDPEQCVLFDEKDWRPSNVRKGYTIIGTTFDWYAAQNQEWNTKWNASDTTIYKLNHIENSLWEIELFFQTAWSAPEPVITKLVYLADKAGLQSLDYFAAEENNEFFLQLNWDRNNKQSKEIIVRYRDDILLNTSCVKTLKEEVKEWAEADVPDIDASRIDYKKLLADGVVYYSIDFKDTYGDLTSSDNLLIEITDTDPDLNWEDYIKE